MKKNRKTDDPLQANLAPVLFENAEKGSRRSMWELLLQLRVLLPYLSHLAPLIERNSKRSPDLSELSRGVAVIQSGSRELETITRNQTLQIERVQEQLGRLEEVLQKSLEEHRSFSAEMRAFRLWMIRITLVTALLVGAIAGMVLYLLLRPW